MDKWEYILRISSEELVIDEKPNMK
jgi:hypothetical protein